MTSTGTYELESQLNAETFFKSIGLQDELIETIKDLESTTEIKQNGDEYKITVTTGKKTICNKFTIGEEGEIETLTGEKVKTTPQRDGNKICMELKGINYFIECTGDKLITTMTLGDTVYTRVSKRVN